MDLIPNSKLNCPISTILIGLMQALCVQGQIELMTRGKSKWTSLSKLEKKSPFHGVAFVPHEHEIVVVYGDRWSPDGTCLILSCNKIFKTYKQLR